ncbi:MAG: hypothetical protein ACLFWH_06140 [Actinomycetota bacterium]
MRNGLSEKSRNDLRRVLGEMESLAPQAPELDAPPARLQPEVRRRRNPVLVAVGAAALVFALALPVVLPSPSPDDVGPANEQPPPTTTPATATTSPATTAASADLPTVAVTELETQGPDPNSVGRISPTHVEDILENTGNTYDPLPEPMVNAAVVGDRVIVVGGNETQTAGIWYSDGGEWVRADIDLPTGVNIGQEAGDYRLADGIEHLEALPDGRLLAWQPIQRVTSSEDAEGFGLEPASAGTLIMQSPDGATWSATIAEHDFTAIEAWEDGTLAFGWTQANDGKITSNAYWSEDLISWHKVADLGGGEVDHVERNGDQIIVSLSVWESTVNDDGSVSLGPGHTTRQVSLNVTSGS